MFINNKHLQKFFGIILIAVFSTPVTAYEAESIMDAVQNGETGLFFRLRHENAKQSGLRTGKATTLRAQLGYTTANYHFLQGGVELIDVTSFFGQKYNPGTGTLAKPSYTLIQDPKGTGLSKAYLKYSGIEETDIVLGRQYIQLDDERFVGIDNFRQYPQSFDAISVTTSAIENLTVFYAYVYRISTILGNGRCGDARVGQRTHLLHAAWDRFQYGTMTGYLYFIKDLNTSTNSNFTYGTRVVADDMMHDVYGLDYLFELARQEDYANNPVGFSAWYLHVMVGKNFDNVVNGYFGYEKLSGDSNRLNQQFRTPLASNHEFLGMADTFIAIPARGIQDFYLKLDGHTREFTLGGAYHFFRFDSSGTFSKNAGHEFDVYAKADLNDSVEFWIGYARFKARNGSGLGNTNRFWAQLSANFL